MKVLAKSTLFNKTVRVVLKENQKLNIEADFEIGINPDQESLSEQKTEEWTTLATVEKGPEALPAAIELMNNYFRIWLDIELASHLKKIQTKDPEVEQFEPLHFVARSA